MEHLRYPIGRFHHDGAVTDDDLERWIQQIEELPAALGDAVAQLSDDQLETRYRPEGWTLRQVIHHVPDSHLNAYVRFKWALTEDEPLIKTYNEVAWSNLADYREVPVATSLGFLTVLHVRWVGLLRSLEREDFSRRFRHPEWGLVELAFAAGMYAWHGRHHLAHIITTVEREGWT